MVRPFRRFYQKWLNTIEKLHAPIAGGSTNIVPGISTNRHPPSIEKLRGVTVEKVTAAPVPVPRSSVPLVIAVSLVNSGWPDNLGVPTRGGALVQNATV